MSDSSPDFAADSGTRQGRACSRCWSILRGSFCVLPAYWGWCSTCWLFSQPAVWPEAACALLSTTQLCCWWTQCVFMLLPTYSFIFSHADKISAQCLCGQTSGTTSLLHPIFCPGVHRSFLAPATVGHALASLPACCHQELFCSSQLFFFIKIRKWNHCDFYHGSWCFSH